MKSRENITSASKELARTAAEKPKSTSVFFSPTIMPPIQEGIKLKHAQQTPGLKVKVNMSPQELVNKYMTIISSGDDGVPKDYDGIFTGGLNTCTAVTIIERDKNNDIQHILMIHFDGINKERLDSVCDYLALRDLKGGNRQLIFTFGWRYEGYGSEAIDATDVNHRIEQLKSKIIDHNENQVNLDEYFTRANTQQNLALQAPYLFSISDSTCATLDGYAGPIYHNWLFATLHDDPCLSFVQKTTDIDFLQYSLSQERIEFSKITVYFSQKDEQQSRSIIAVQDAMEAAIEADAVSDTNKAALYFCTRKFLFDKEFKNLEEHSLSQNAQNDVFQEYQKQVTGLNLSSESSNRIFTAIMELITKTSAENKIDIAESANSNNMYNVTLANGVYESIILRLGVVAVTKDGVTMKYPGNRCNVQRNELFIDGRPMSSLQHIIWNRAAHAHDLKAEIKVNPDEPQLFPSTTAMPDNKTKINKDNIEKKEIPTENKSAPTMATIKQVNPIIQAKELSTAKKNDKEESSSKKRFFANARKLFNFGRAVTPPSLKVGDLALSADKKENGNPVVAKSPDILVTKTETEPKPARNSISSSSVEVARVLSKNGDNPAIILTASSAATNDVVSNSPSTEEGRPSSTSVEEEKNSPPLKIVNPCDRTLENAPNCTLSKK